MPDDQSRRRFLVAAGSTAAAALAGCTSNQPSETQTTATTATDTTTEGTTETTETTTDDGGATGGTLRLASIGKIQTLDPVNAKGSGAGYNQYGESLFEFPDGDLPPKPSLATDFSTDDDQTTYTFQLKEGVTFHDGSEMTASDVVYSYRRLAGSEKSRNKDDIIGETMTIAHEKDPGKTDPPDEATPSDYVDGTLAVRAPDTYTFEFDLERPFHDTLSQIAGGAFAIIPENAVGDIQGYDGEFDYQQYFGTASGGPEFAATGPFKVDSWSKGNELALSAYDDYHGEGPLIDGITYTVLSSPDTALQRFNNENLDIIGAGSGSFPLSKFDPEKVTIEEDKGAYRVGTYGPLGNGETVNYGETTTLETEYFLFNCKRVPKYVRQAVAFLINQEAIADEIYKGAADPAYHLTPPGVFPDSGAPDIRPGVVYDRHAEEGFLSETKWGANGWPYGIGETRIDDAKALMRENGHGPDDPYELTLTVFQGGGPYQQIAQRLRSKGQAAFLNITIEQASFGTILSKGGFNHELDAFSLGDGMEFPESDNFLRFLHPSVASASAGFTQWGRKNDAGEWATEPMRTAEDAWQNLYKPNRARGEAQLAKRDKAYRIIEEVNWEAMQELTTVHSQTQRFWYDSVEERMVGTMENQTFNTTRINRN